ncbi:MAG: hypothetical protein Q8R92_08205 [Deltaproteobacteria bacterium]|nr:hypothetical protein [Deltaproteobacteria bacterium]
MSKPVVNKTVEAKMTAVDGGSLWARRGDDIVLVLLVTYVILLGIGTVAELFDVRSILSWPIYR